MKILKIFVIASFSLFFLLMVVNIFSSDIFYVKYRGAYFAFCPENELITKEKIKKFFKEYPDSEMLIFKGKCVEKSSSGSYEYITQDDNNHAILDSYKKSRFILYFNPKFTDKDVEKNIDTIKYDDEIFNNLYFVVSKSDISAMVYISKKENNQFDSWYNEKYKEYKK